MNKLATAFLLVMLIHQGLATETFVVTVRDNFGQPVTNATVGLKTMNKLKVFGSDKGEDFNSYLAATDSNGCAVVRFKCLNGAFDWWVSSSNYYGLVVNGEEFKLKDPLSLTPILSEHERHKDVVIWKKICPRPLFLYGSFPRVRPILSSGCFGFDLQKHDWVKPYGVGEIADFTFVQEYCKNGGNACLRGKMVLAEGSGAYVKKQTGYREFLTTYSASTNQFVSFEFPFACANSTGQARAQNLSGRILKKDEYLILRTRVCTDENGLIRAANYSEIIGPFEVFCDEIKMRMSIFNPEQNDTNLEFDWHQNLSRRRK